LDDFFAKMKQWFTEVYTSAEASGLEISDTMRGLFRDMLGVTPEESDALFRYGLGRLMEYDPTEGMDTETRPEAQPAANAEESAVLTENAERILNDAAADVANYPDVTEAFRREYMAEAAEYDANIGRTRIEGEALLEAAICDMRA
jgi:hypothetical protein